MFCLAAFSDRITAFLGIPEIDLLAAQLQIKSRVEDIILVRVDVRVCRASLQRGASWWQQHFDRRKEKNGYCPPLSLSLPLKRDRRHKKVENRCVRTIE